MRGASVRDAGVAVAAGAGASAGSGAAAAAATTVAGFGTYLNLREQKAISTSAVS